VGADLARKINKQVKDRKWKEEWGDSKRVKLAEELKGSRRSLRGCRWGESRGRTTGKTGKQKKGKGGEHSPFQVKKSGPILQQKKQVKVKRNGLGRREGGEKTQRRVKDKKRGNLKGGERHNTSKKNLSRLKIRLWISKIFRGNSRDGPVPSGRKIKKGSRSIRGDPTTSPIVIGRKKCMHIWKLQRGPLSEDLFWSRRGLLGYEKRFPEREPERPTLPPDWDIIAPLKLKGVL